ncbi:DUF692 domain-containing protein [Endozoicomonas sp. SM1973]|uniref:DUF692 domain-containing protein n=1 Tax=Spartinivicinus marinus TaxID=2994442 RepID=A0A853ID97_9GAMM|nr:DUF692 domain-containing protein [Spartinivicinus marinus]MCX4028582.1 DUF692 domain-containing protein [Spartinivicinus marinus]NYZ67155.1 DUF692 domain-containing protein [Spartinivicinus marinus]
MISKQQSCKRRLGLTHLGLGVGLRNQHFPHLMQNEPQVDWFEIISENFIDNYGYDRYVLNSLREKVPIVMHGVSLSIGSSDPLDRDYLNKLKQLADEIQVQWVSDHLCWTGIAGINTHDLLPIPLTEESLLYVAERVRQVQDFLERPLILENPSTYVQFTQSTLTEWEFLSELTALTACGLLLDVNNVFVSAYNHRFDPWVYIENLPHENIVQVHLAGPTKNGDCLIDTHDQPVPTEVWLLYQRVHHLTGGVSTLLEWDANIPDYPQLTEEVFKAKQVINGQIPNTAVFESTQQMISNPINFQLGSSGESVKINQ